MAKQFLGPVSIGRRAWKKKSMNKRLCHQPHHYHSRPYIFSISIHQMRKTVLSTSCARVIDGQSRDQEVWHKVLPLAHDTCPASDSV